MSSMAWMVGTTEERAANGLEMVFPVWALRPRNAAAKHVDKQVQID